MFVKGGIIPVIGFHSTIESPLSVNLVRPPSITIPKTNPAVPSNQYPTMGLVKLVAATTVGTDDFDVCLIELGPFSITGVLAEELIFRKELANKDFDGLKNSLCL